MQVELQAKTETFVPRPSPRPDGSGLRPRQLPSFKPAIWWRSKPTWRQRRRSGLGWLSRHPGWQLMRDAPHRCRRRGGNPHDGEIITHAPNLMWGTDGVTVDEGLDRRRALERRVCRLACLHRGDRFAACSRSPWGLPGCMARPRPARLGGPCKDHFTNQIKFMGHPAPSASPRVQSAASQIYRNIAELRDAVRDSRRLQSQWIGPEPRSSSSGVARRDLNQARRVRQTCVQGTGCATRIRQAGPPMRHRGRRPCAVSCPSDRVGTP